MNYTDLRLEQAEYHKSLLGMLKVFDRICIEDDMPYSLAGGTLLGAARHQGFIPWDDDVDVFLLRPDFERFIEKYSHGELIDGRYQISSMKTGLKEIPIARLLDMKVKVKHDSSVSIPKHAWIDIVPLDAIPNDGKEAQRLIKKLAKWREIRILGNALPGSGKSRRRRIVRTFWGIVLRGLHLIRPISKHIDRLAKKTNFEESKQLAEIVIKGNYNGRASRELFQHPVLLPFEGYRFMCMPDYSDYLRGQYGMDYLKLMPKNLRESHGVRAWLDKKYLSEEERKALKNQTYMFE